MRRVVSYGTPVVGGPSWTAGAGAWSREETSRIADLISRLDAEHPIQVPLGHGPGRLDRRARLALP